MAAATQEQKDKDDADFAEQFDAPDAPKKEMSEDEAFGLSEPAPGAGDGATTDTGAADAGGTDADAGAAAAGTATEEPQESPKEKELREREAALQAREAELAARDAATQTSNVGETQSSGDADPAADTGGEEDDPGKLLADDFGPDFVHLLTRFIEKICAAKVGEGVGSVSATVDEVIRHLQSEREANHFKAIKAAHEDFMEIVESPDFNAWKASQSPEEQTRIQHVTDSGSAQQIIDMLTDYKGSKGSSSQVDQGALDDAEGVRSGGGMTLPKEPASSDDYAKAWDEA